MAMVEVTITALQLEIVPKPVALWLQARDVLALGKDYFFIMIMIIIYLFWVKIFFFDFLANLG